MLQIPSSDTWFQRYRPIVVSSILVLLLIIGSWLAWQALAKPSTSPIRLATVNTGDVVDKIVGYGRLKPRSNTSIIAQSSGRISAIHYYPGANIARGTILFEMHNPELERKKQEAELELLKAKATYESATAKLQREALSLTNDIDMAQSDIRFSEKEMNTLTKLYNQQLLSELDYLRAQTRLEQSRLTLNLAKRSQASFLQSQVAEKKAIQYNLQAAEQALALVHYDIEQLNITAEQSGVLRDVSENVAIGKPITKGEVLAVLTDPNSLYAEFSVAATEANRINIGDTVSIDIRGQQVAGKVLRIHPLVEANQVRVEATIEQALPSNARENLDISANIIVAKAHNSIRVQPPSHVNRSDSTYMILVKNGDKTELRTVHIGVLAKDNMEVISGLSIGDKILLEAPENTIQTN